MVRLCSESSRSYSGRPVARACRQRQDWPPAMALRREQESAEAVVPRVTSRTTKRPEGLTTRKGLNLAGRHDHRWSCPGAMRLTGRALGSDHCGRERVLLRPGGLPGIAVRGPACTVVWEAGGETLPPTRFGQESILN